MSTFESTTIDCPPCRFGHFALDPAERRLLADGKPVALGARAFDLLLALVARPGQLVSKNDLLTQVWPGLVVEENNLQVQVSALRKWLGPGAVATIPGRGYRFELPVEVVGESSVARASAAVAPAAPPAAVSPAPTRASTNVPLRQSTIFGRAHDLAAITALLQRHSVVTIAGAGGIGKTRVAQAAAAQLAIERVADFPDGVWWVELAPLADGALVAAAVAQVLGAVVSKDRSPVDTVAAVLAPQRLLLVLDNCEHVIDDVATFIDVVGAVAPGLRVLATSQETLKAAGEHVYRLGALGVPTADADLLHAGAVELFAARAQAVDRRFELSADNIQVVAEICRRLDGIPLAIELAAARVPLLGVEGLRARLDERFSVLTGGARMVLRRHQTLRATLEWSHALLTLDEQTVFRRLGVFPGSFTLEAAQYVAQDAQIDGWAVLDHLGALVDKSLVLAEGDPVPRYRLLETTRAYALERLGEAGETAAMLRRHADALLLHLLAIDDHVQHDRGPLPRWQEPGLELDNLRAALAWAATASGVNALAIGLVAYSMLVWEAAHQMHEGLAHGLAMKPCLSDDLPKTLVARYWLTIAGLGLYSTHRETYEAAIRSADLYRELNEPRHCYDALIKVAAQGVRFGSLDTMERAIDEAAALVRPDWPPQIRARLEFARSRLFARQLRYEESLHAAEQQVAIAAQGSNEKSMHYAMSNVVAVEVQLGRNELALTHARESIARLEVVGGSTGAGHLWLGVMQAEAMLGRVDAAFAAGRIGYALLLCEGDELRTFRGLALCAALRGRYADAARIVGYLDAALARAGTLSEKHWTTISLRLESLLDRNLDRDVRQSLHAEGATLREDVAVRMALDDGT